MTDYETIKARLKRERRLFEDPDFPANRYSIRRDGQVSRYVKWLRPKDVVSRPKFIRAGATRFDLDQGDLGDCWFVAGAACLAVSNRKLFERCVHLDQSFDDDYYGIFRFTFWHFDRWQEVVVDDRLPTEWGKLMFAKNRDEPDEFWAALMEKAYAKLYGCYENIDGGHINDALVDFTGGISEVINLKNKSEVPSNLFTLMYGTLKMNSMVGCSIEAKRIREESLGNGLYGGHAYSITNMVKIRAGDKTVKLIRLRNPWGRDEWKGPWHDRSSEWNKVDSKVKKQLQMVPTDDGEFWMEFEDWVQAFEWVQFCHLFPDALTDELAQDMDKRTWRVATYHDQWVRGVSAGGCGNPPYRDQYWRNPQFFVKLTDADDDDKDGLCTLVLSLMQKSEDMQNELYISFTIYKVRSGRPEPLEGSSVDKSALQLAKSPKTYTNLREVTARHLLKPGNYVIIPATFEFNKESEFLLRIYSEKQAEAVDVNNEPSVIEKPIVIEEDFYEKLFKKFTNGDQLMDSEELMNCINEVFKEATSREFGMETARSLLTMCDTNNTGALNPTEFRKALKEMGVWKDAFQRYDTDNSGSIDTYELNRIFIAIGYRLSRKVMGAIIKRYGGKKRRIVFEDFVHCCTKILLVFGEFMKHSDGGQTGKLTMNLDQWLTSTLSF